MSNAGWTILPNELNHAREFGVSPGAMRRALHMLADDKLLTLGTEITLCHDLDGRVLGIEYYSRHWTTVSSGTERAVAPSDGAASALTLPSALQQQS